MYISDLAVDNFRSYEHQVVQLARGVNAFVGKNGQGKTNLVEAVAYLATFSSHRVAADTALVRAGCDAGVIRAKIVEHERETVLEIEILAGKANRARINRVAVPTREVLGHLAVVVFAPEDLALVKGDPRERRRFIDQLCIQRSPRIAAVIADLDKLLRQRSALLKRLAAKRRAGASVDISLLEVFDEQFITLAAQLTVMRMEVLSELRPYLSQAYHQVASGQSEAAVQLKSGITGSELTEAEERAFFDVDTVADAMRSALARRRDHELERAVTLVGPQRDDLVFTLGELPARGYASHGESWSLALALRLASFQLLCEQAASSHRGTPLLILDDVFAELDATRRDKLAEIVKSAGQVLITAAVPTDVPAQLDTTWFSVANATVNPTTSPHEVASDA